MSVDIFKVFVVVNKIFQDLAVAMQDNVITIDEIYKMVNDGLRAGLGKDFSEIGLRVSKIKDKNGKERTKLEFIF